MTTIVDTSAYKVIWSGNFLNGSLAIVTDDPAACKLAWSFLDQDGERFHGTMELQEPESVTPEMRMKIVLASIKQEYEQDKKISIMLRNTHGLTRQ